MGQSTDEVTAIFEDPKARIHREIIQTEARMSDTIHDLEERLSPAELKRRAVEKVKAAASAGMEKLKQQNAGPAATRAAAVIGAGVGILMIAKAVRRRSAALPSPPEAGNSGKRGIRYGIAGLAIGAAIACLLPKSEQSAGAEPRPTTATPAVTV